MNRSAAMAQFLPLLLVLLLATGKPRNYAFVAAAVDEPPSTSRGAVPGPSPPKGYEPPEGPPAPTGGHETVEIGACFPNNGDGNALFCLQLCRSKGYSGGHCDALPGVIRGDCYCFT